MKRQVDRLHERAAANGWQLIDKKETASGETEEYEKSDQKIVIFLTPRGRVTYAIGGGGQVRGYVGGGFDQILEMFWADPEPEPEEIVGGAW